MRRQAVPVFSTALLSMHVAGLVCAQAQDNPQWKWDDSPHPYNLTILEDEKLKNRSDSKVYQYLQQQDYPYAYTRIGNLYDQESITFGFDKADPDFSWLSTDPESDHFAVRGDLEDPAKLDSAKHPERQYIKSRHGHIRQQWQG